MFGTFAKHIDGIVGMVDDDEVPICTGKCRRKSRKRGNDIVFICAYSTFCGIETMTMGRCKLVFYVMFFIICGDEWVYFVV